MSAQSLFERLMSLAKPDDARYYLEVAGLVRVLFDKGDHAAAFDLLGRSALTAMDSQGLPIREAFDMLAMAKFGDLAASVNSTVFLEAVGRYESRHLANENLGLADLWRQDPRKRSIDCWITPSIRPRTFRAETRPEREEGGSRPRQAGPMRGTVEHWRASRQWHLAFLAVEG